MAGSNMTIEQMDNLIDWTLFKWRDAKASNERGETMQDEVVIELRADFGGDKEKTDALVRIACSMARTMITNASCSGVAQKRPCSRAFGGLFCVAQRDQAL